MKNFNISSRNLDISGKSLPRKRRFEEDENAPKDNRFQSPTLVTRRKKSRSASSASQQHVFSSSPCPTGANQQETNIAVAERPYHRWQRQLKLWFYQLVHREPHDLPLSASTQSRIRLTFTVRNAGLAKEDEYVAVHGRRRVEIDENVELERAPSRGEEAHIISASSCSTIARRNKRILDHLRVSPLNTSVFGPSTNADRFGFGYAVFRTHYSPVFVDTRYYTGTVLPSTTPRCGQALTTGLERRVRKSINHATSSRSSTQRCANPIQVKRASFGGSQAPADDDIPGLPVDEEKSDGPQADEELLAESTVRPTGLANVDTRRESAVVSASR
ncbi:hypothetical protein V8E53_010403 [Lactarius tabidus]